MIRYDTIRYDTIRYDMRTSSYDIYIYNDELVLYSRIILSNICIRLVLRLYIPAVYYELVVYIILYI